MAFFETRYFLIRGLAEMRFGNTMEGGTGQREEHGEQEGWEKGATEDKGEGEGAWASCYP